MSDILLPEIPQITEVEIELTNHCNANCVACPRDQLSVEKGYMTESVFCSIIQKYSDYRKQLSINKLLSTDKFPALAYAGMGETLLHKNIFDYIRHGADNKFFSVLFTNASLLDQEKAYKLCESGINQVYISFWGINEEEYRNSMGLEYKNTLKNVEFFSRLAKKMNIPTVIIWVENKYITSTKQEIERFWQERNIAVDTENAPWNRGGYLSQNNILNFKGYPAIDFDKDIWCSQLYFTDTIAWNGDVIICSCDYYKKQNLIGNINTCLPEQIALRKKKILDSKQNILLCKNCKKPDRNYYFGSEPWDNILDHGQKSKYWY